MKQLTDKAKELGDDVYTVCKPVFEDERFPIWSGSSKPFQHHYGRGGLISHTTEVVSLCFLVKGYYHYNIDDKELFLSAFFHDVGKMYDYKQVEIFDPTDPAWGSAEHKRMIHHISRSGIIWSDCAQKHMGIYHNYFEKVLHSILAHHTAREHGSPVAPKSRVAWMVTLCDNLSARMCDADTFDVLGRKEF